MELFQVCKEKLLTVAFFLDYVLFFIAKKKNIKTPFTLAIEVSNYVTRIARPSFTEGYGGNAINKTTLN